jgi:2-keto-3-deoxy-L-rhamnonate aldolase RhmA
MRAGIERGEVQIGTWVTMVRTPSILSLLKAAGLDFARIDMEHAGTSIETVADMAVLARALDFPIAVRPPKADREWITRLLDVGVWNIHCPQVENAEHAAEIVAASRYASWGLRGNGGRGPAMDFETSNNAEFRAFANKQVFITVMLETAAAFDHLDAIAAMDGIDALTLGPADLAQDLGVVGTPDQTRILDEKRDLILSATKKHGKTCAMLVSSPEELQRWKKAGALLLAYSSEVVRGWPSAEPSVSAEGRPVEQQQAGGGRQPLGAAGCSASSHLGVWSRDVV